MKKCDCEEICQCVKMTGQYQNKSLPDGPAGMGSPGTGSLGSDGLTGGMEGGGWLGISGFGLGMGFSDGFGFGF